MAFVLDCSVTMAWIFPEEASDRTSAVRESLLEESAHVPGLWPIEVANVLLMATRRGRVLATEWPKLLADLAALPIEVDDETGSRALGDSLHLASEHGLSVYDAVYLELAVRRDLPIATLDQGLTAACHAAGVELV